MGLPPVVSATGGGDDLPSLLVLGMVAAALVLNYLAVRLSGRKGPASEVWHERADLPFGPKVRERVSAS